MIKAGLIDEEQLKAALKRQRVEGGFLGSALLKMGFISDHAFLKVVSEQIGVEAIYLDRVRIPSSVISLIPEQYVKSQKVIPIAQDGNILTVASANPLDFAVESELSQLLGVKIKLVLAIESDIENAIHNYYEAYSKTDREHINQPEPDITSKSVGDSPAYSVDKVVAFVNRILSEALDQEATDIHFEPYEDEFVVRYRIDGLLKDANIRAGAKNFQSAIISRVKILSKLNIAEQRLPQDGRIQATIQGKNLDFRVSTYPTPYGESIVIRLLGSGQIRTFEALGFAEKDLEKFEQHIKRPYGIILLTGPTGSGKSTTLYAALNRVNNNDKKIITLEDPIEYQIKGVTQSQIHTKIGHTFATGLRAMLRHDPDIMMVGEIRDRETADISVRLALTGHLVFSTLHTNDAPSTIIRLQNMGIESFLLSSSIKCMIAQRLVRLICESCKEKMVINDHFKMLAERSGVNLQHQYRGAGCSKCNQIGYKGRTTIYEIAEMTPGLQDLIHSNRPHIALRDACIKDGMVTLQACGWRKIDEGVTTPEEVMRVTAED